MHMQNSIRFISYFWHSFGPVNIKDLPNKTDSLSVMKKSGQVMNQRASTKVTKIKWTNNKSF